MKVFIVLCGLLSSAMSEAPYPASGWKPSGALLVLPSRQQLSRQELPAAYGAPQPNTPNQVESNVGAGSNNGVSEQPQGDSQVGSYYILLPDGRLQKIQYAAASAAAPAENKPVQPQNTFKQDEHFNFAQNSQQFRVEQSQNQNAFGQHQRQNQKFSKTPDNLSFGQATNNVNSFQRFDHQQSSLQNQQNSFSASAEQNNAHASSDQSFTKSSTHTDSQTATGDHAAPHRLVAQFSEAQLKANGPLPDGFVASVQFSDVPPITAPIYAFNPAPLVRVLRMPY